ncbi:GtrA family protein [Streptomyces sp. NBC_01077]|uniref:GtrA family protein n=1 Tax=Streptomyces sp. NBC_01077 TaxID=2903746 RepID=UPI00386FFEB7|nr:GtrA family protein [Streptomyces sp. NBC_01077]
MAQAPDGLTEQVTGRPTKQAPERRTEQVTGPARRARLAEIFRFGLVGGVNTVTFFGCYLLLHPWMPYFAAYSLAFLLSMVGSFFLNTYFTYRTRPTWKKFALFPLTNVTNYLVQSVGLYALVTWAGMDDRIAPLVAAVVAIPFTYLISQRILVPRSTGQDTGAPGPGSETDERQPSRLA